MPHNVSWAFYEPKSIGSDHWEWRTMRPGSRRGVGKKRRSAAETARRRTVIVSDSEKANQVRKAGSTETRCPGTQTAEPRCCSEQLVTGTQAGRLHGEPLRSLRRPGANSDDESMRVVPGRNWAKRDRRRDNTQHQKRYQDPLDHVAQAFQTPTPHEGERHRPRCLRTHSTLLYKTVDSPTSPRFWIQCVPGLRRRAFAGKDETRLAASWLYRFERALEKGRSNGASGI